MQKTILIVEDDPANAELFETYLSKSGYAVYVYLNGMRAYEAIENGFQYDLGLFDLSLPFCDGFELLKISKEKNSDIPVFTMSGYAFRHELSQRHLHKPFRLEDLLKEVKSVLK